MSVVTADLGALLVEEAKNGSRNMVTRQTGERLRNRLENLLSDLPSRGVLILDFSSVGIVDFSCADEVIAKVASRLIGGEYGDKYVVFSGMNDTQRENVVVALERKKLPGLEVDGKGDMKPIGEIKPYLLKTLQFINERTATTAGDLARLFHLHLNTSSTRLINLYKQRLACRMDQASAERGREYVYAGVEALLQGKDILEEYSKKS